MLKKIAKPQSLSLLIESLKDVTNSISDFRNNVRRLSLAYDEVIQEINENSEDVIKTGKSIDEKDHSAEVSFCLNCRYFKLDDDMTKIKCEKNIWTNAETVNYFYLSCCAFDFKKEGDINYEK